MFAGFGIKTETGIYLSGTGTIFIDKLELELEISWNWN